MSTHALHLFAVGVTLYAILFHWTLQRDASARRWLTAWSVVASLFLLARSAQMATDDPVAALWLSRAFTALGPVLVWTMLRFTLELAGTPPGRGARRAALAATGLLSAAALLTPWFLADEVVTKRDWFGEPFLAARGGPAFFVLGALGAGAVGWCLLALARSRTLPARDRGVLGVCIALYAGLGASSVLSALGESPYPGMAEFGPLVVALGTSRLVANREHELARNLNALVDQQTAALRVSEDRYRRLVDHAPIGVLSCDAEGNVLTITRRFREILELGEAGNQAPLNLFRDAPERAAAQIGIVRRAFETESVVSGEIPYRTFTGKTVELRVVIAPQPAPGGGLKGALILIEDVTERRAVEARLRQSLKLEAIGQLAAGIAQGINGPLVDVRDRLIRMRGECDELTKLAGAGGDSAPFAEIEALIDESCEGVERALAIVRDMREISRGGTVAIESLDLDELLRTVVRMAGMRRAPGAELVACYGARARIEGNAGQLQQVFLNLVVNALQAVGERGRVEIESREAGDGVCVSVRDDGTGIRPEDRERLFVPFFTTKPAGEGTGLGLFLSYQIVQRHGGEIRVDSAPGVGATFEVWLPRRQAPAQGARP